MTLHFSERHARKFHNYSAPSCSFSSSTLALFAGEQAERKSVATTRTDDGDMEKKDAEICI